MNDCFVGKQRRGGDALGSVAEAAPAQPHYTVGEVGFGPAWQDDDDGWVQLTEKGWRAVTDNMAACIIRLEQEREEFNARIAVLEEQARILVAERDQARNALREISGMDTSQDASPNQCGAVLIAMNALEGLR